MRTFTKTLLILILFCGSFSSVKAQFVTIPDPNFAAWLNTNGFSSCMNGNQLDTLCSLVVNTKLLNCSLSNISDLTGIVYFDNLDTLLCNDNSLTSISDFPDSLKILYCHNNSINTLSNLPNSVSVIYCYSNVLTSLSNLPTSLKSLVCSENNLFVLPSLPNSLVNLHCSYNQLSTLPPLPSSLISMSCNDNILTSLPALPLGLKHLFCFNNQLIALPALPASLTDLSCSNNQLTSLPVLPDSLNQLFCEDNFLSSLPDLPDQLLALIASNNLLTSLPELNDTLRYLSVDNNVGLTCLPPKKILFEFKWANTAITCFPNVIVSNFAFPPISGIPICDLFNPNDCKVYWNIRGKVFCDQNINCTLDSNELVSVNVKLKLFESGNLVQQTFVNSLGQYSFDADSGNYTYNIDTMDVPFVIACPTSFSYVSVVNTTNIFHENKDFSLTCKPGFDVGVTSMILDSGFFRPASFAIVSISAGDMSSPYYLNCASGVSGNVIVIMNGPATILNAVPGSLVPIINGDTLLYSIPDFGAVNFNKDFRFLIQTDTLAQLNEQVCFNLLVTPLFGDNIPSNNYYNHCFTVVNSYDPNDKQVSPTGPTDTSQYWLTYTIRFQNTGNAPAQHVYIIDSLHQHIDESSIQLLAYSHEPLVQVIGNVVKFNFHNINLPDSVNNEPDSHGYVQYKVRRNDNLPIGTQIHNTAYIYFDFNPPIQTNTTTNTIAVTGTVGMQESLNAMEMTLYPNPLTSGEMLYLNLNNVSTAQGSISLFEMGGRKVFSQAIIASAKTHQLTLPILAPGIYLAVFDNGTARIQRKLVVVK